MPKAECPMSKAECPMLKAECPMPKAECPMPKAECLMPKAECPMPKAGCPMLKAECPMPNADLGQIGQIVLIYNVINTTLWAKSSRAASLIHNLRAFARNTTEQCQGRRAGGERVT